MSLFSAIRVALAALLVNKGRSTLTSLGIVIGISAVIAMVSAGAGARHKLDDRLESVGSVPDLQRIRNWQVVQGRFYTEEEVKKQAEVCLLGETVLHKLFPDQPN